MMWVIRGTNTKTHEDFSLVVEAKTKATAESWAAKRGLPVAFVGAAEPDDIRGGQIVQRLWKHSPEPRYMCLGRPVAARELALLMIIGVATIGLLLTRTTHLSQHMSRATAIMRL